MPKLNDTHLPERLKEAIKQLEAGEEVEAKKNKTLLNATQQKELENAWTQQQALAFPRFSRQLILSTMSRRSVYEENQIHS